MLHTFCWTKGLKFNDCGHPNKFVLHASLWSIDQSACISCQTPARQWTLIGQSFLFMQLVYSWLNVIKLNEKITTKYFGKSQISLKIWSFCLVTLWTITILQILKERKHRNSKSDRFVHLHWKIWIFWLWTLRKLRWNKR